MDSIAWIKQNIISILVGHLYRLPYTPCKHTPGPFRVKPWMACVNLIQYLLVDGVHYVCFWYLCAGPSCNGIVLASLRGEVYRSPWKLCRLVQLIWLQLSSAIYCSNLPTYLISNLQFVFMAGGITARFQKERSFQCITGGQQKELTWRLIHSGAKRRFSWTRMPLQNNMVLECIFKHKESSSFYHYQNFVIVFLMYMSSFFIF